jgi:hypothetical protein
VRGAFPCETVAHGPRIRRRRSQAAPLPRVVRCHLSEMRFREPQGVAFETAAVFAQRSRVPRLTAMFERFLHKLFALLFVQQVEDPRICDAVLESVIGCVVGLLVLRLDVFQNRRIALRHLAVNAQPQVSGSGNLLRRLGFEVRLQSANRGSTGRTCRAVCGRRRLRAWCASGSGNSSG